MRIVKRDAQGFYLDGDGIWRDQDGVSEKFRGEDVDWFGAIEEALGDACSPERIQALVQICRQGTWVECGGEDQGFHHCSACKKQAFNYEEGSHIVEVLTRHCAHCGAAMDREGTLIHSTLRK